MCEAYRAAKSARAQHAELSDGPKTVLSRELEAAAELLDLVVDICHVLGSGSETEHSWERSIE
jgi:hypothetical protein